MAAAAADAVSVHVSVRIRPLKAEVEQAEGWAYNDSTIGCKVERYNTRGWSFGENRIYLPSTPTRDVYERSARSVVQKALEGYHGYVFAYGQTGSGKTYTMLGTPENPGIIPLAVQDIFAVAQSETHVIRVSYLEIHNEQVRDLLDPKKGLLDVFLDEKRVPMLFVGRLARGAASAKVEATMQVVNSAEETLQVLMKGEQNRHYARTDLNKSSSRSHTLFRIEITTRDQRKTLRTAELFLIDLAGMESIKKSGVARGTGAEEAGRVNKSLLALEKVVRCLDEGSRGNVSALKNAALATRESKLTRFLKPALGGNSCTAVICTITPALVHVPETLTTLEFAARAMNVRNRPRVNEVLASQERETQLVREYREQADAFRQQLSAAEAKLAALQLEKEFWEDRMRSVATSPGPVVVDEAEAARRAELERQLAEQQALRRDLEAKIHAVESILLPEQERRRQAEEEKDSALRRLDEVEAQHKSREAVVAELQQTVVLLRAELRKKEEAEVKFWDRVDALELHLDEATETINVAAAAQAQLERTVEERDNRIAELEQKLRFTEHSLRETEVLLGRERAAATRRHYASHGSHDSQSSAAERSRLQSECAATRAALEEARAVAEEAGRERNELRVQLAEAQQLISQLRLELDKAERRTQTTVPRDHDSELQTAQLVTRVVTLEELQQEQQQRLSAALVEKAALQQKLDEAETEAFTLREENVRLKAEAEAAEKVIAELRSQSFIVQMQALIDQHKERAIRLQNELEISAQKATQRLAEAHQQIERMRERALEAERALEEMKRQGRSTGFKPGPRMPKHVEFNSLTKVGDGGRRGTHVMRELLRMQSEQLKQKSALADDDVEESSDDSITKEVPSLQRAASG